MKTYHKGFVTPLLLALIAILLLGGGAYVYMQKNQANQPVIENSTATSAANQYVGWNTYTNTQYGYSIKYPNNWFINTKYSEQDFTPRGPVPHDYIGGDTSLSNYSDVAISEYQKTNGEIAYPKDYLVISWMFFKSLTKANPDGASYDATSVKKENVTINGVSGIKTTLLGLQGIGSGASPNSVSVGLTVGSKSVSIGYGFNDGNAAAAKTADQIINSFALNP